MKIYRKMLIIAILLASTVQADMGPYDWAYVHLDSLRDEKVVQLRSFCDRIHLQAKKAASDQAMIDYFDLTYRFSLAQAEKEPPKELSEKIELLNTAFQEHYIRNWLSFYDILFINMEGNIFYSIRKEADYKVNLLKGSSVNEPLSKCISEMPDKEVFIDFHYYGASDEPASFFVEPVFKDNVQIGWLALQLAVNKINSIFASSDDLGTSCEAFVVNRQGYMLTESNFVREDTILKTKLDEGNIEPKFQEKRGNRFVTDYRGFKVLTAFEVFEFLGTQWLVVAKIDQPQITTEHFKQHNSYYSGLISEHLNKYPITDEQKTTVAIENKALRQVDMDEFVRAENHELLQTFGVSTCTAVVAMYPEKFGYMAHISPLDKVYGGNSTDLIGSITKKIKTYDIYKYERPYVKFVIVARHLNSLDSIVNKLVEEGFLLSQISIMYYPQARHARVVYDYSKDQLFVEWVIEQEPKSSCYQNANSAHNIGQIVKQCVKEREEIYAGKSSQKPIVNSN